MLSSSSCAFSSPGCASAPAMARVAEREREKRKIFRPLRAVSRKKPLRKNIFLPLYFAQGKIIVPYWKMADALPVTDPVEVMCAGCYTRVAKRTQKCDKCGNLYCDRICRRHDKEHTEEVCKQMANVRGQGWNLPEIEQKMGRENVSWLFSHYLSEGKLQELIEEAQEDEKDDM